MCQPKEMWAERERERVNTCSSEVMGHLSTPCNQQNVNLTSIGERMRIIFCLKLAEKAFEVCVAFFHLAVNFRKNSRPFA